MVTRAQIVNKARSYVGTPFQHQARVRGVGMDCVGLVLCVGEELKIPDIHGVLFSRHAYPFYNAQPPPGEVLKELRAHMPEKTFDLMDEGDVVAMKMPFDPCHAGIVAKRGSDFYIIHAYNSGSEKVVEHIVDKAWRRRMVAVFNYPGVV